MVKSGISPKVAACIYPHTFAHMMSKRKWVMYRHLIYISKIIAESIYEGNGRLIVSLPPRHGKSFFISYWLCCWFLNLWAYKRIILATYEADFAQTWGRRVRNEITSNSEIKVSICSDSSAADRWDTTEGGGMMTSGIGGAITGKGADLLLIDDPVKNWQQATSRTYQEHCINWFNSTLYTRCEPNATIILLMTRWNERDLAGYLINEHEDEWKEIRLPAIAEENDQLGREIGEPLCPERYPKETLEKMERAVGKMIWAGLFQQRPRPQEGVLIKTNWFKYWDILPEPFDLLIQSWDMSFKDTKHSAYVCGQVWGKKGANYYLIGQRREKMDIIKTIHNLLLLRSEYPDATEILIEDKANGPAVISMLKDKIPGIIAWNPQGDKVSRVNAVLPVIESGNVYVPSPEKFPWVSDFIAECLSFPKGEYKDQVDTMSQALIRLIGKTIFTWDNVTVDSLYRESIWSV